MRRKKQITVYTDNDNNNNEMLMMDLKKQFAYMLKKIIISKRKVAEDKKINLK